MRACPPPLRPPSPAGNEKALATVTAIIDGMGSIGAAIGPLMTGYICLSAAELPGGFDNVFLMLYGAAAAAGGLAAATTIPLYSGSNGCWLPATPRMPPAVSFCPPATLPLCRPAHLQCDLDTDIIGDNSVSGKVGRVLQLGAGGAGPAWQAIAAAGRGVAGACMPLSLPAPAASTATPTASPHCPL